MINEDYLIGLIESAVERKLQPFADQLNKLIKESVSESDNQTKELVRELKVALGESRVSSKDVANLPSRDYFRPREVAELLDIKDDNTVREWCKGGRVEATKDEYSGRWLIPRKEVEMLVRSGGLPPRF